MIAISLATVPSSTALHAQCYAFNPDYRKFYGDEKCSVQACDSYDFRTLSSEQEQMCADKGKKQHRKVLGTREDRDDDVPLDLERIKTYEADNGEKFKVDLSKLMGSPFGPPGVQVWIWDVGFDTVPHPTIFSCGGGGGEYALTDLDDPGTGWFLVPSRSVLADIARDACSVAATIRSPKKGPNPQPARIFRTAPNTTKVTQGMTPDEVVAILGPPISITMGAKHVYTYPHVMIVFTGGKVSGIHQIQ